MMTPPSSLSFTAFPSPGKLWRGDLQCPNAKRGEAGTMDIGSRIKYSQYTRIIGTYYSNDDDIRWICFEPHHPPLFFDSRMEKLDRGLAFDENGSEIVN